MPELQYEPQQPQKSTSPPAENTRTDTTQYDRRAEAQRRQMEAKTYAERAAAQLLKKEINRGNK